MTSSLPPYFSDADHPSREVKWRDAVLTYEDQGRGGTIRFVCALCQFSMWWEFAGGDALVLIGLPSASAWEQETGIPLSQREDVAHFVGDRVLRDKIGGRGRWTWNDPTLTLYT